MDDGPKDLKREVPPHLRVPESFDVRPDRAPSAPPRPIDVPQPDVVHAPRVGPPSMPSLTIPPPDEVHTPRQGPPRMPSVASPRADEVRPPRQGPPAMPTLAVPPADVIQVPRQGPPHMPTPATPTADVVHAPRQGPPRMPPMSNPDAPHEVRLDRGHANGRAPIDVPPVDEVRADRPTKAASDRPLDPPSEFEVRRDHPVRTEIPPLPLDPGKVEIAEEGLKRKVRVMTTGVFDLIHLGHLHMLQAARDLGDELFVVIARDETVRKMKHEPLNPEEVRRQIVEGLKPVTKAVLGHLGDIYRSVQDHRPDIIALGYDQKFTEEEVRRRSAEHGVQVRVVRLPQFDHDLDATRKIIERIGDRIARKELYTSKPEG